MKKIILVLTLLVVISGVASAHIVIEGAPRMRSMRSVGF